MFIFHLLDEDTGDNPIMIAAKLRHKDLVSSVLRSARFDGSDDMDFLAELIHSRNNSGQTLLAMVALQGKTPLSLNDPQSVFGFQMVVRLLKTIHIAWELHSHFSHVHFVYTCNH